MPTLAHWLRRAAAALSATSTSARLDAEVLARYALSLSPTQLIVHAERELSAREIAELDARLVRRARGEPVPYIVGTREFWSLPFKVNEQVLIPRSETELLVACALRHIPTNHSCTVADLGTGSGAIALAIAHERPRAHIIATDISPSALAVAQDNARALGVTNVEFRLGDWCAPLRESCKVIVSNPPYVRADDTHLTQGDVRFEPMLALAAGVDGLSAIRAVAAQARAYLADGGVLMMEHGYDQQSAVIEILQSHDYRDIEGLRDLAAQPRAVAARVAQSARGGQ